ncbi:hypothetical protein KUA49_010845 [Segatella copri]|uniref:hypothetical protein n=1 Tax=Segatella copri TaxID=165179 RepID=UPI001C483232|nr:hypothetical protein [Segatella copri]WOZ83650.1 hypothetical protein KUA49_010845 [Segatella copri]
MDNQKNPVAAQQYRMKSSIEEYEANGLNSLLMQMHHWALDKRIVSRRDSLIYFNVAYAVAAPLEATSEFSVKLVRRKIEDLFEEGILKRKIRKFSQNDTLLSLWMVYGILHLQCHRSYKLNCRLEKIRSEITEDFILWEVPHMKFGSVATQFSAMIDAVEDRFYSPELHEVKPDHRDSGEQPMNLNEMKIQALEAQLEEEKEKNEHCKAIEKSNYLTASFNLQLEKRFKLLERQLEDVNARHNREMRNMQLIIEQKDEEIRQLKELLKSRVPQKANGASTVNNYFLGSVGVQSNSANNVTSHTYDPWDRENER